MLTGGNQKEDYELRRNILVGNDLRKCTHRRPRKRYTYSIKWIEEREREEWYLLGCYAMLLL
jgi:hypothetical protein